jgi:hypothetical protein
MRVFCPKMSQNLDQPKPIPELAGNKEKVIQFREIVTKTVSWSDADSLEKPRWNR